MFNNMMAVMDQVVMMWILGGFASVFFAVSVAGFAKMASLSERVTRLEAVMSLFGEKAAKILHSPDDHLGIDSLLEKYIDRHYELSWKEWEELLSACEIIENDTTKAKGERTLAAWLAAVSSHKLHRPPVRRMPLI